MIELLEEDIISVLNLIVGEGKRIVGDLEIPVIGDDVEE